MSSIPQFYSNHTFPNSFADFSTTLQNGTINSPLMEENTMWGSHHHYQYNINSMLDNFGVSPLDHIVPTMDCDPIAMSSSPWFPAFSEQAAMPEVSDFKTGFYGGGGGAINGDGFQSFSGGIYQQQQPHSIGHEFGEECCGMLSEDVKPLACPVDTARETWGIHGNQMPAADQESIKVGRYSEEERKERILRYLRKRNQRNFNKTIKYACRKTLADRRVRVRGRFARNNELCDDEMTLKKNHNLQHDDLYAADSIQFQLKKDEEDWLQEAMESLVFLSHSSPEAI